MTSKQIHKGFHLITHWLQCSKTDFLKGPTTEEKPLPLICLPAKWPHIYESCTPKTVRIIPLGVSHCSTNSSMGREKKQNLRPSPLHIHLQLLPKGSSATSRRLNQTPATWPFDLCREDRGPSIGQPQSKREQMKS